MTDNCDAFESLLAREAERASSADPQGPQEPRGDAARLAAHLETCASCRAALADQRAMRELLRSHPVDRARLGFDTRVMAAIRAEADGQAAGWLDHLDFRRWTFRLVPVAVALALASVMIAAPASGVISQTDTTGGLTGDGTTMSAGTSTDGLPVSSALWSESVSGSSLLSLMLTANADDTLATYRKDQ
jgi:hypothetical protein